MLGMSEPPEHTPEPTEPTAGTGLGHREVTLLRTPEGRLEWHNRRGGTLRLGDGTTDDWTPVELMLASIAGCSAVDVHAVTSRRAAPEHFEVRCSGEKRRDEAGNYLGDIEVTFTVRFPEGEAGDRAREMLPRAMALSHDRSCTVSQTIQRGAEIAMRRA